MQIMTRMGTDVLAAMGEDATFVSCLHSWASPLDDGAADVAWPCNETKYISQFPETRRDLELRIRLRRQLAARQEVLLRCASPA
jgi:GTP-dependent phosphoenolpyruvate carboxykinase